MRSSLPGPAAPERARLERVRSLARLLDSSIPIPGTGRTIGLDPLIGLIPGVGDLAGAALSGWILLEAAGLGASKATLLRMAANVALEAAVGTVPLLGDLFDAGWKANVRNVRLLNRQMEHPEASSRASRRWVWGVMLGLAALLAGAGAATVWMLAALLRALGMG